MRHIAIVTVSLSLVLGSASACAHAQLEQANPAVGSTVRAPHQLSLSFTQKLEKTFSSVEVRNAAGAKVDQGNVSVSGNRMSVGLGSLPPGTYKVHWHVLSVDTHKTEGSFSFSVSK
jgi:copper resistance protein C